MMMNDGVKIDFCKLGGYKIDSKEIYGQRCEILNIPESVRTIDICFHPEKKRCPFDLIKNLKQFYTIECKDISVKITFLSAFDREIQSVFLQRCDVISIPTNATKAALCFTDEYEKIHRCYSWLNKK